MSDIEWKDPPPRPGRRVDKVAAELRDKPLKWARIEQNETVRFFPWWLSLVNNKEFEIQYVHIDPTQPFGPRDIYARFIGEEKS